MHRSLNCHRVLHNRRKACCQTFAPRGPARSWLWRHSPLHRGYAARRKVRGPVGPGENLTGLSLGPARRPARRAALSPRLRTLVPQAWRSFARVAIARRHRAGGGSERGAPGHVWQEPTFRQPSYRRTARSSRLRIRRRVPGGLYSRPADAQRSEASARACAKRVFQHTLESSLEACTRQRRPSRARFTRRTRAPKPSDAPHGTRRPLERPGRAGSSPRTFLRVKVKCLHIPLLWVVPKLSALRTFFLTRAFSLFLQYERRRPRGAVVGRSGAAYSLRTPSVEAAHNVETAVLHVLRV
jgi:hypothetical protein